MTDIEMRPDVFGQADLPELAAAANRYHDEAVGHARSALECAWHAGHALLAAKKLCRHGEWTSWLAANFRGSHDLANKYMRLAKSERVLNLDPETSIREALKAVTGKPDKEAAGPSTLTYDEARALTDKIKADLSRMADELEQLRRMQFESELAQLHAAPEGTAARDAYSVGLWLRHKHRWARHLYEQAGSVEKFAEDMRVSPERAAELLDGVDEDDALDAVAALLADPATLLDSEDGEDPRIVGGP
jgi:hypothetical protein